MAKQKRQKTGGRQKGSKNKSTLAKKERLEMLFIKQGGFDTIFKAIKDIEQPKDKANAMMKVMEFFMAKHSAVEHSGDPTQAVNLIFDPSDIKLPTNESEINGG